MTLALRRGPRLAWATVVGLLVRATLLRPGRTEVRDPTGFPGWAAYGPAESLRVVALPGVGAPLALVRWPEWPGDEAEVVDVELGGGGTRAAAGLLAGVVAATRRAGAGQVRVPPNDALDAAARLLAFRQMG